MKKLLPLLLVVVVMSAGVVLAQTQDKPPDKIQDKPAEKTPEKAPAKPPEKPKPFVYHSSTSIALLLARGNNRTLSFSFDTDQNFVLKENSMNFKGTVIYAQNNGSLLNEIYYTHLKFDHQLMDGAYLLSLVSFDRNILAGFPSRFSFSAGGGCTWVKTAALNFFSDLALGWSSENAVTTVNLGDTSNSSLEKSINSSFLSTILTSRVSFNLTPTSQVIHQEVVFFNLHDVSDYRVNSLSSLSASFSRYFGLKMTVQVNYERKPVLGYKNTDVFLISSLVIAI